MSKNLKIGLTGGIASGKTTVSDNFKKLGNKLIVCLLYFSDGA